MATACFTESTTTFTVTILSRADLTMEASRAVLLLMATFLVVI